MSPHEHNITELDQRLNKDRDTFSYQHPRVGIAFEMFPKFMLHALQFWLCYVSVEQSYTVMENSFSVSVFQFPCLFCDFHEAV